MTDILDLIKTVVKGFLLFINDKHKSLNIFFKKISFDTYINSNYDERLEYIERVFYDNFHDKSKFRVENILYSLDSFIHYFERTDERLQQY